MKINRLFFTQGFADQQIDLKQYSKPYWQPMNGTKQWKTVSKCDEYEHMEAGLQQNLLLKTSHEL